jgi:hypothetical protein
MALGLLVLGLVPVGSTYGGNGGLLLAILGIAGGWESGSPAA